MNNNKSSNTVWGVIIAIIVIGLIIFFVARSKNQTAVAPADQSQATDSSALDASTTASEDTSAGSVHASTAATISYNDALALYQGKRVQFNTMCQADPSTATFTNDTTLMLDNRSATTANLHLGFMGNVSIKPWGFKIVQFSSATLPRAIVIDCNQSQNVASISLQK